MPPRSKAQKAQLLAVRTQHLQAGESSSSPLVSTEVEDHLEIQSAIAARNAAEEKLAQVEDQLQAKSDDSKNLYKALCAEKQRLVRAQAAKANAEANAAETQSSFEQLESQFEQLTLKNEQLEQTMIELLENFAGERKIAAETLQDC
jgi:hypothetical protein